MSKLIPQDSKKNKVETRSIEDIRKDADAWAQLTRYVEEAVNCKITIQAANDTIKALRDEVKNSVGIEPALFNTFVALTLRNDHADQHAKLEQRLSVIEVAALASGIELE